MEVDNQKSTKIKDRLSKSYRLILQKEDTFEEKGAVNFSLYQFYILSFLAILTVIILISAVIIFTPLKRLIPGYGELTQHKEIYELYQTLDEMEARMKANETYTQNFMKMLNDSTQTVEDVKQYQMSSEKISGSTIEKVKEDEELRQEIAFNDEIQQRAILAKSTSLGQGLPLDRIYFLPPLNGPISAAYQPEKKHYGIDILAPKNTPIKASLDGFVIESDWTMDAGNTIGIQHSNNIITFYKHNSTLLKKVGDRVKAGEAIAIIGNSGELTDGPHLHFEIWHQGKPINPDRYVEF